MKTVTVSLPENPYTIHIGRGLLDQGAKYAAQNGAGGVAVVSDENVWRLHGAALTRALECEQVKHFTVVLPPGEGGKTLAGLEKLLDAFAENGLGRDGLAIAFGGGMIGDLTGFAASVWMRGIASIQIPTSLLAQVDSSVGGKTGVNLDGGKNLAGTFWQPRLVVADTALLDTLPEREWRCGLAEMVKYGALFSDELFEALGEKPSAERLPELVRACCQLKSETVRADEREAGQRKLLNFGHTFGHAVEKLGGYSRYNHGEAVAIGMVLAAGLGEQAGITAAGCRGRLGRQLAALGLPVQCPYGAEALLKAALLDKKGRQGGLDLILLRDIGRAEAVWYSRADLAILLREVMQ